MVKHIVMFKLKENTPENRDKAIQSLNGLKDRVESVRSLEVGVNFTESDRAYDLVLTVGFDDQAGLNAYAVHPDHQPTIQTMKALSSGSIVVDYEI